ncbi:Transcriptional regulator, LacI family [Cronobacter sakazakii 696]|nr:Transcriptional regulator, LacI family [Cronobacter sakazakii 696]
MGHREVLNVLCLRRYTMELRLAGIRDAWEAQNLAFDETRHLLTAPDFSARGSEASSNPLILLASVFSQA